MNSITKTSLCDCCGATFSWDPDYASARHSGGKSQQWYDAQHKASRALSAIKVSVGNPSIPPPVTVAPHSAIELCEPCLGRLVASLDALVGEVTAFRNKERAKDKVAS